MSRLGYEPFSRGQSSELLLPNHDRGFITLVHAVWWLFLVLPSVSIRGCYRCFSKTNGSSVRNPERSSSDGEIAPTHCGGS